MKLLAIDTSSDACSVALQLGGEIIEKHVTGPREHTNILMPMITGLLDEGGVTPAELDAVVLGNGPGSFIGMRIGASVAQGLCHGAGLNIIPISSLAAVAAEVFDAHAAERVVVLQDARMNEVYLGCFRKRDRGLPQASGDEQICAVGRLPVDDGHHLAAGAAWQRYPELLPANSDWIEAVLPVVVPRARFLLPLGAAAYPDAVAPDKLAPAYLRIKVAERPRPRR